MKCNFDILHIVIAQLMSLYCIYTGLILFFHLNGNPEAFINIVI